MIGRVKTDQKAIAGHYAYDKDFFLRLMDASRCYSQAVYERDDETREAAQRRKLDYALAACRARAGDQTLDIWAVAGEPSADMPARLVCGSPH